MVPVQGRDAAPQQGMPTSVTTEVDARMIAELEATVESTDPTAMPSMMAATSSVKYCVGFWFLHGCELDLI